MGTAERGTFKARFKTGTLDYALGGHPLWELFRTCYQMSKRPFIIGGLTLLSGYLWAFSTRAERPIPPELVKFRRSEQMQRLRSFLSGKGSSAKSHAAIS